MTANDLFLFDMTVTQKYYILTENRDQRSPPTHTVRKLTSRPATYHYHHHHHHLALQPIVVFAFSARSLQVLPSLAVSFQFFILSFLKSSMTFSCHRFLGLPTVLVPIGFQSNSFLDGLAWSILCIWPSHLILCALMNLTISAPYINPQPADDYYSCTS